VLVKERFLIEAYINFYGLQPSLADHRLDVGDEFETTL
jgi:hypothetical protein